MTHHIQAASVSVHRIACLIIHKALIWVGWCLAPLYPGISGHLSDRSPLMFPLQAVWWFSLWPVMDPEDAPYSLTGGWGACRGKHVRARAGACREGFCCGGSPVRRGDERCCRPERWSDHWGWRHSAAQDSNSVFFSVFFFVCFQRPGLPPDPPAGQYSAFCLNVSFFQEPDPFIHHLHPKLITWL